MTISKPLVSVWIGITACLAGISLTLYFENQEIKTVPVFIYAGPNAPQDIVSKINESIDSFDENKVEEWYKDCVYDKDFQMAMFYSYLATALAEKASLSPNKYEDGRRRDAAFAKSLGLWSEVIKQDDDLVVFRDYFIKKYKELLKSER